MISKRIAPYGSWKSPITATAIASESFGLAQVAIDGDDLYWTETRPWEGGRSVIVRRSADGETSDVTPEGFNVRNRVHEYGGGAFAVHDGVVYFTNDSRPAGVRPQARWSSDSPDTRRSPALCRPRSRPSAQPHLVRERGPLGARHRADQYRRRHRHCQRRGRDHRPGKRLLLFTPHQSERRPGLLAGVGPSEHALGRNGAVGGRRGRRRQARQSATRRGGLRRVHR